MKKIIFKIVIFINILLLISCGGSSSKKKTKVSNLAENNSANTGSFSEENKSKYKEIFQTRCSACHGVSGAGDGAASKSLTPPPRDLTSSEWQDSVGDDYLKNIIQFGGSAVGKSAAMPSNPDLTSNPEMLNGIVSYIRSIKK